MQILPVSLTYCPCSCAQSTHTHTAILCNKAAEQGLWITLCWCSLLILPADKDSDSQPAVCLPPAGSPDCSTSFSWQPNILTMNEVPQKETHAALLKNAMRHMKANYNTKGQMRSASRISLHVPMWVSACLGMWRSVFMLLCLNSMAACNKMPPGASQCGVAGMAVRRFSHVSPGSECWPLQLRSI